MVRPRQSPPNDLDSSFGILRLWALIRLSPNTSLLGTAALVGVGTSIGAMVFRRMIDAVTHYAFTVWLAGCSEPLTPPK